MEWDIKHIIIILIIISMAGRDTISSTPGAASLITHDIFVSRHLFILL